MNQLLPAFIALGLAASATSVLAAQVDLSKLPPPAQQENVTYAKDIKPIFDGTCIHCHGGERPKGKLRLDSLEGVLKGGEDGKVVVPGESTKSKLVIAVARLDPETAMPPKPKPGRGGGKGPEGGAPPQGSPPPGKRPMGPPPKPLTPEQVGLIRAWVDQGAK